MTREAQYDAQIAHLQAHYDRAVANGWREAADWAYELRLTIARRNIELGTR